MIHQSDSPENLGEFERYLFYRSVYKMSLDIESTVQKLKALVEICREASDAGVFHLVFHPFYAASTLIKLGYEPLPPVQKYSIFRGDILVLPGVVPYARYLWMADGFPEVYRSAAPSVCKKLVSVHSKKFISSISPYNEVNFYHDETPQLYERFTQENLYHFGNRRLWTYFGNVGAVIASHPLRVVALHCISAFANGVDKNRSPIQCLLSVLRTEGIPGLFAGIVPLILGKTFEALISSVIYIAVMNSMQSIDWRSRPETHRAVPIVEKLVTMLSNNVALTYASQFYTASDLMVINGSAITELGNLPFTPIYSNWIDCWANYPRYRLYQATYIFFRPYPGPVSVSWGSADDDRGVVRPVEGFQHFGPTRFPQQGQSAPWLLQKYYENLGSFKNDLNRQQQPIIMPHISHLNSAKF